MKRDLDLIRRVLLVIEQAPPPGKWTGDLDLTTFGYTDELVQHHLKLLKDAGFVNQPDTTIGAFITHKPLNLTWEGHDFLDAIRNDTIWNQVKQQLALKKLAAVPLEVLKAMLIEATKAVLGSG